MTTQILKPKCPHCGWIRTITVEVESGDNIVIRGLSDQWKATTDKLKEIFKDRQLKEANAWIDMPACPNPKCGKTYQYNKQTGETRP